MNRRRFAALLAGLPVGVATWMKGLGDLVEDEPPAKMMVPPEGAIAVLLVRDTNGKWLRFTPDTIEARRDEVFNAERTAANGIGCYDLGPLYWILR